MKSRMHFFLRDTRRKTFIQVWHESNVPTSILVSYRLKGDTKLRKEVEEYLSICWGSRLKFNLVGGNFLEE